MTLTTKGHWSWSLLPRRTWESEGWGCLHHTKGGMLGWVVGGLGGLVVRELFCELIGCRSSSHLKTDHIDFSPSGLQPCLYDWAYKRSRAIYSEKI